MESVAVKVSPSGRMTLPSEVRKALGLNGPRHLSLALEDGAVTVRTMAQALEQVCTRARPYAPTGRRASEKLIAERRQQS